VVSEDVDGALAEALTLQAGYKVTAQAQPRGQRRIWQEMCVKGAELALARLLSEEGSQQARTRALVDALDLQIENLDAFRIECFDISHTAGESTQASCVVFEGHKMQSAQYRRYNIDGITGGDDYAAMRQALERRYKRIQAGEGRLPDLLLIDGGKGQVQQAIDVLNELGVEGVPIVGVAKGEARKAGDETLILGNSGRSVWPGPESLASHLIQAVRDEAHRFAITGHRGRREKVREASTLQEIAGVGARRRSALLKHFGGLAGLSKAGIEELMLVKGISRELAERIYATLHG
jgi:excinuclease ABC subunit C